MAYEYKIFTLQEPMDHEYLGLIGEMGWEMCGVYVLDGKQWTYYFKKEKGN